MASSCDETFTHVAPLLHTPFMRSCIISAMSSHLQRRLHAYALPISSSRRPVATSWWLVIGVCLLLLIPTSLVLSQGGSPRRCRARGGRGRQPDMAVRSGPFNPALEQYRVCRPQRRLCRGRRHVGWPLHGAGNIRQVHRWRCQLDDQEPADRRLDARPGVQGCQYLLDSGSGWQDP